MALVEARLEEEKNVAEVSTKAPAALSVQNVLFATDFSFTSESARPYAIALCRHFGSTLHTAHVVSDVSIVAMTGGVDYVGMSTLYEDARSQAKENSVRFVAASEEFHIANTCVTERFGRIWRESSKKTRSILLCWEPTAALAWASCCWARWRKIFCVMRLAPC